MIRGWSEEMSCWVNEWKDKLRCSVYTAEKYSAAMREEREAKPLKEVVS